MKVFADAEELVRATELDLRSSEERWRRAEADAASWRARADALDHGLGAARAAAGAEQLADVRGVIGPLVDLLVIEPGTEVAVAAALGDAMYAVVVDGGDAAAAAIERLRSGDTHGLLVVLGRAAIQRCRRAAAHGAPDAVRSLADCVDAREPALQRTLRRMLVGAVLVEQGPVEESWPALELALAHPELVVFTADGDRLGGAGPWRVGGAADAAVTQAALDEAVDRAVAAEAARAGAESQVAEARAAHEVARARAFERGALEQRHSMLVERLVAVETRLALRDPETQTKAEQQRAADRPGDAYGVIEQRLVDYLGRADALHERLRDRRRRQSEAARASAEQLDALRVERTQLERGLTEVRERLQRTEVEDAETRLRLETAVERLRADFDVEPSAALDAPAPEAPAGTTLAGRARELDRELRLMGPINPLALEEHDALLERHQFLQEQLEDVKGSRRELNRVIRAVDREIVTVFADAFEDVSRHFTDLFTTLFPGGTGRAGPRRSRRPAEHRYRDGSAALRKERAPLSLLSGGERSLTALAFLFGVFRARPSPFYLMDEVEAALDDVNLHRFLDLVHEFRDEAQLLIVSHQKRTMEAPATACTASRCRPADRAGS